ncbi:MAG: FAD-dependent oxidoreductase, partial [bacterium]|nr:FAD-dependent oxidoreductase [bacterium]
ADCYPPCRLECPANVDVQGYIALASRGLYAEGQKLMRETNAMPMVCGRICAHPCEDACRRNYVDEPVDIKNIKRYMSDKDLYSGNMYMPNPGPDTGKKVAVIGSGPAGLAAANYLRILGHAVTIFEMMPQAGGMMRYGIPEYRLPKADLQGEIDAILSLGVDIQFNKELGKDITLHSLEKEYDAVFLGIGAQLGSSMGVPGEDLEGVMQGVDFLRDVNLGKDVPLHGTVFIVGGGNTAIDAARTSLRSGADRVAIVYRRSESEMPAAREEIEDAKEEGIELLVLNNPVEYSGENGKLASVKLVKMELGEPDSSGRRRPVVIEGSEYSEQVNFVIEAIGQKIDTGAVEDVAVTKWGTIVADENLYTTSRKGVFAGGDAVEGPWIVIGALAHGRKAAFVMDRYLKGQELEPEKRLGFLIRKEDFAPLCEEDYTDKEKVPRKHVEKRPAETRKKTFEEVELGFGEENLLIESSRCMECGCEDIYECKLKQYSAEYGAEKELYIGGEYREDLYQSRNDYISVNTEKCINCGQCIRLCAEVQKQSVFSLDKRGFDSKVVPYTFKPLSETNCTECGACVSACPVGAIVEQLTLGKPGPFESRLTESHCNLCGDVCKMVVETRDGNFIKISSKMRNDEFFDNLCKRGRFCYDEYERREGEILSEKNIAEIRDFIHGLYKDSSLVGVSPELTVEEIDLVAEYAGHKGIDLFCFELLQDLENLKIIDDAALILDKMPERDLADFTDIYYFGSFTEEYNSVSFRKIIKNDKKQNIYLTEDMSETYFDHKKFDSNEEMLSFLKNNINNDTLLVFNLQQIEKALLKELAEFIRDKEVDDYLVLNNHANYGYIFEKVGTLAGILEVKSKIDGGEYKNFIAVNVSEELIPASFKNVVAFSDKEIKGTYKYTVPINSIYEKSGTLIDQFGETKMILKGAADRGVDLKEFF